jgi:oxygen-independent coproporphyrinogen-3 oxidase
MKPMALYLHIPFCRRKCLYCDFCSFPGQEEDFFPYLDALEQEFRQSWDPDWEIATLYIGGGTPTLLPPKVLAAFVQTLKRTAPIRSGAEITIEANPGTVNAEGLAQLLAAGINRLSLGAQSSNDRLLRVLGRMHTAAEVEATVAAARREGFTNISLDLIYGLPGESLADWEQTLQWATALQPDHLSCYGLQVEAGTPLYRMVENGKVHLPEEEESSAMFLTNTQFLSAAGYQQYEISNFARLSSTDQDHNVDYRCRHNLIYWESGDYLGLGLAACSTVAERRWMNVDTLTAYYQALAGGAVPTAEVEKLSRRQRMAEMLMLGFRLRSGPDPEAFRARWGMTIGEVLGDRVEPLLAGGFLQKAAGGYRLTSRGMLVSNTVLTQLLAPLL